MEANRKMPLIISVPHGGIEVPKEVEALCRLSLPEILADGDTWAGYLFDVGRHVKALYKFEVARAVLDLNRADGDRPPHNPDGVVKTVTVDGQAVWISSGGLNAEETERLLVKYYYPYHNSLAKTAQKGEVLLGLDCHTMLAKAPLTAPNPGGKRPLICLSNRGGESGEALEEPLTAPPELIRDLGRAFKMRLQRYLKISESEVLSFNRPFKGGYLVRKHRALGPVPWIQVELNRSLYLSANPLIAAPDPESARRIGELRELFLSVMEDLFYAG